MRPLNPESTTLASAPPPRRVEPDGELPEGDRPPPDLDDEDGEVVEKPEEPERPEVDGLPALKPREAPAPDRGAADEVAPGVKPLPCDERDGVAERKPAVAPALPLETRPDPEPLDPKPLKPCRVPAKRDGDPLDPEAVPPGDEKPERVDAFPVPRCDDVTREGGGAESERGDRVEPVLPKP